MSNTILDSTTVGRRWALFIEQAQGCRGKELWSWRFDGTHHRFMADSEPAGDMLIVSAYRQVTGDLKRRLLLAAAWPGPAGIVRAWPAWRRERIEELSGYCTITRATANVNELIDAVKQGNIDSVLQAVAQYERVIVEANADREVFSTLCAILESEAEQEDSRG